MIKKILTIACSLVLCLVCLTGCSWLEIDRYKYYNSIVVSIDNKNFYKKDLIEAFSNYGYQYYEQYSMTLEDSVNKTIESMIDRWLLLQEVANDPTGAYDISEKEAKEIKQQAFDYMRESVYSYESKIRKEWDIEVEVDSASSGTTESLRTAETEYTPSTEYEIVENGDGTKSLRVYRVESDEEDEGTLLDEDLATSENWEDIHFDKTRLKSVDQKIANEAWTRYVKSLQDSAKGEGRNTDEKAVLLHEENRLIELIRNNLYLEKYEKAYKSKLDIDTQQVLDYFKEQYLAQKQKYDASIATYHTDMKNASSNYIYYHPIEKFSGNEYVRVKHILINFTDLQKEQISQLKSDYGITDDNSEEDEERKQNPQYQQRLQNIVNKTTSKFEMKDESGNTVTKEWNALVTGDNENNVYEYVTDYVSAGSTFEEKCRRFNELVYVFNDDTGFMNSEFDYVVNLDTNVTDQMVKPFADGVRSLDTSNGGEGEGSMKYIVSEYGIHIIFHAGNVGNIVSEDALQKDEDLLRKLCTTTTTPESNKSIFNFIYDKLASDSYDAMTEGTITTARTELKKNGIVIHYYVNNYKDLWS